MSPLLELAWRGAEGYRGSIARITLLGTIAAVVESATLIAVFAFVADLIGEHTSSGAPSRPSLSAFLLGLCPSGHKRVSSSSLRLRVSRSRYGSNGA
jgi:hypothetical protein